MMLAEVWTIAAREFLANVKTLRFTVCLVLAILLGALVSYIATDDYERELKEYSAASALSKDQIRGIRVWMELKPTVHKRPEPLSIFAQGISKRVERSAAVQLDRMPELSSVGQRGNPFLSIFPALDMLIVVKVVLGLLAILLSFDAVAGEREKGTLSLTLSNPVSRAFLLVGKCLGAMSSLAIAAAVGFLTGLIVFVASPMVSLSWGEWGRIGLIFLCTLLYLGQFYFLGLIVSSRTRSAGTALGITVLCWAVLMVIVPNLAVHAATKLQPLPPKERIDSAVKAVWEEFDRELERLVPEKPKSPEWLDVRPGWSMWMYSCYIWGSSLNPFYGAALRPFANHLKRLSQVGVPLRGRYAEKAWQVSRQRMDGFIQQRSLSQSLSLFSPGVTLEACVSGLAGTDVHAYEGSLNAVREYRRALEHYVSLQTKGFTTLSYFTPATEDEIDAFTEALERMEREGKVARVVQEIWEEAKRTGKFDWSKREEARRPYIGKWLERRKEDFPPLDLRGMPIFSAPRPDVLNVFQSKGTAFAMLLVGNVILFLIAVAAFLKYDVRT